MVGNCEDFPRCISINARSRFEEDICRSRSEDERDESAHACGGNEVDAR